MLHRDFVEGQYKPADVAEWVADEAREAMSEWFAAQAERAQIPWA
jgi:hypothetical protein